MIDENLNHELRSFIKDTERHQSLMVELVTKDLINNISKHLELIQILTGSIKFFSLLTKFIDRAGLTEPQFYSRACISTAVFSNMRRDDYTPSKASVLKSIIGLKLNYTDASALLEKAGYTFVWSDTKDLTIVFCIMNEVYNPIEVDELLTSIGENTLFSQL
ncbi:MAG: hypothetical protein KMY55_01460 [Dethiosulfatibacter sp.]|nr:hypothetical protein [Dethiosulfatibacter sp.]